MHTIRLSEPLKDSRWELQEGEYLAEDLSAAEICMTARRGTCRLNHFTYYNTDKPTETASTLLVSNAGYGDMLCLVPAIREFLLSFPHRNLAISTRKRFHCMFDGLPFAFRLCLINYPTPIRLVGEFDRVLTTEGLQEDSEFFRTWAAIDIRADVLGVSPLINEQRRTEYVVSTEERYWATAMYPHRSMKRVGIQLAASSPTRSYHPKLCGEVMRLLYEKGYELYLFGAEDSIPMSAIPENIRGRVKNLTADKLSFRQSAAVLQTCDCFFGPDSGILHVAGALNIPAVGVFSSTHWSLRTAEYKSVFVIQSNTGCEKSPCFFHPKFNQLWPKGGPCEKAGHCVSLNEIPPSRVVAEIEKKLSQ